MTIPDYLAHLQAQGRSTTATTVSVVLREYAQVLAERGKEPATATPDDLAAYQLSLGRLARSTVSARLSTVRAFHRFLRRRGLALSDPTRDLALPVVKRRTVRTAWLDQQEAMALLATATAAVQGHVEGSASWAAAVRDLAVVALALATGRRRSGICAARLEDLDLEEAELRVEREKGRVGRVLPVASWAVAALRLYLDQARSVLLAGRQSERLFVGERSLDFSPDTYRGLLGRLHAATVAANPDLSTLPGKKITTHALRTTFARVLFANGCPIRSINELLLHTKLSTTAAYTPIPLEELRRVLRAAHPRP